MSRVWPSLIGAVAFAMPMPAMGSHSLSLSICGQPGVRVVIPMRNDAPADNHGCCKSACHAGCERKRGKSDRDEDEQ